MPSIAKVRAQLGGLTGALVVLTPLSQLGFVPISVIVGDELGVDAASVGLAIGLYAVSAAVGTIVLGPIFDLVPARKILPWAVIANLAVSMGFIWVPNVEMLVAGRVFAGVANSALILTASVLVADAFRHTPADRDRAFSGLQTYTSTGAIAGLTLGGLCAGLGTPWLYFTVVAGYAAVILCLTPLLLRRMRRVSLTEVDGQKSVSPPNARPGVVATLAGVGALLRSPRTGLLLLAAACGSWVLQGGHYSLSVLMAAEPPHVAVRTVLTIMIPIGVLAGALTNQWSLSRMTARGVYSRAYLALPVMCGLLAASFAIEVALLWGAALFFLGLVCGMLTPLQPTLMVGWYPSLRGSASAAVSVANSAGAAVGPMIIGIVAVAWAMPGAVAVSAVVALIGAVLAGFLGRGPKSHSTGRADVHLPGSDIATG